MIKLWPSGKVHFEPEPAFSSDVKQRLAGTAMTSAGARWLDGKRSFCSLPQLQTNSNLSFCLAPSWYCLLSGSQSWGCKFSALVANAFCALGKDIFFALATVLVVEVPWVLEGWFPLGINRRRGVKNHVRVSLDRETKNFSRYACNLHLTEISLNSRSEHEWLPAFCVWKIKTWPCFQHKQQ